MTNKDKKKAALLVWLKNFCTRNVALKIVAVVFALLLWGYVISDQKPVRIKTITDVTTSFDGEAELLAQGLCVRGDRTEILKNATVSVKAQITNFSYLTPGAVNATVSLKNISEAREYDLPVQASISSALGVVQSVSPNTVHVEIDTLVTKTIPVSTSFSGELPAGYWADVDAMSATAKLDIQGAKTDISQVTRAECVVDLTGRTSTIYSTFDVILYDADGQMISSEIVVGTIPSSTVRLPIYPMKTVRVDVMGSLVGTDNLAANHEIYSVTATPETVRLVGDQALVDATDTILLEPISVSGLNAAFSVECELIVPEGLRLLDADPVTVHIDIRETVLKQTFEKLLIDVQGLPRNMTATLDLESVDLTVEGRISIVSILKRADITVFVDVTGLAVGTYNLPLSLLVRDEKATVELTTALSADMVTVVLTSP